MQSKGDALPVGSQLQGGKYVIEAVLGQGSFGITYRAANTGSLLHKQVAIKELFVEGSQRLAGHVQHPAERSDESWGRLTANFEREAQTLARLKHPNIVTVHDAFAENGTIYIVMEFVDGTTLDQLVRQRGGKLPEDEALRYIAEIADALSVLHKNGVLHRDIKPSNIVIDKPGHAMLIDFGTARDFVADKTLTHSVVLTPAFAPPEQFQARARRGPYTDIYALAATTYWLLTGEPPAMGEADVVKDDTRLSPQIRTALAHALAFNSAERTQDAASFMRELLGPGAQPAAPPPASEATSSVSGFQRGADADANATTVQNQSQPRQQWDAETYDESRGNQPPFTASELASRQLRAGSGQPRHSLWLVISGVVAAAALLSILAFLLLGGNKGNGTNIAGSTSATLGHNSALSIPSYLPLFGIHMTSTTEGWAVGDSGAILHYSDGSWKRVSSPSQARLFNVAMVSANEGWAVSASSSLLHYSSGSWAQVSNSTTNTLLSVAMVSASDGWAVGENGTILHYSGDSWAQVAEPVTKTLSSVAMISANEGWAVGENGTILHYSGGSWTEVSSPADTQLWSAAMVSANEGWAVGDNSTILHYSGGSWMKVNLPIDAPLFSVAMVSADEGWAVGDSGTILHYSEGNWVKASSPTDTYLKSITMVSANEGWAVGNKSTILHYTNGLWNTVISSTIRDASGALPTPNPTQVCCVQDLTSIYMVSASNGWATGSAGSSIFLHYTDGQWQEVGVSQGELEFFSDVYMTSAAEGWAVGQGCPLASVDAGGSTQRVCDTGYLAHYTDGKWSALDSTIKGSLNRVYMVSANEGWAVGYKETAGGVGSLILHYSGGVWRKVDIASEQELRGVYMISANEGWAVGNGGTILHYSNGSWALVSSPTNVALFSVAMVSANEGWAVGDVPEYSNSEHVGIILHYQNGVWSEYH